jgi:hypothetical protein
MTCLECNDAGVFHFRSGSKPCPACRPGTRDLPVAELEGRQHAGLLEEWREAEAHQRCCE